MMCVGVYVCVLPAGRDDASSNNCYGDVLKRNDHLELRRTVVLHYGVIAEWTEHQHCLVKHQVAMDTTLPKSSHRQTDMMVA